MDARSVVLDCQRYSDTVAFFYILYTALKGVGLSVEVEQDRKALARNPQRPDFCVIEGGQLTDVLEHKGSLTDPTHTAQEFDSVAKKYSNLEGPSGMATPRITLLYPKKQQGIVDKIRGSINQSLNLCAFDQASSDTEIRFDLLGPVSSSLLGQVLGGGPIRYKPEVRSEFKYIRAEPPVPYTALAVWQMFPSFKSVRESDLRYYDVSRSFLLRKMQDFYPRWIRDNEQVNAARVDAALEFLDKAGFVEWRKGADRIRINSTRGTRSGDLLETLARHFVKQSESRGRMRKPRIGRFQRTLNEF